MGLYAIKPWFVRRLRRVEDALVARRVSPDALTAAAVVASLGAGAALALGGALGAPLWWLAVPVFVLGRLALNALDGSIARRTRTARPFGAVLNEAGDRLSDAVTIGGAGIAAGAEGHAMGAIAASFAASMTGVLALAVTGRRDSGGPMGKADRGAAIAIAALCGAILGSSLPLLVAIWIVIAGSAATAVARTIRIRRTLEDRRVPVAAILRPRTLDVDDSGTPITREMCDGLVR